MTEISEVYAKELSIRLGALLANHIFSLDSMESLDLTLAMGIIDARIAVCQENGHEFEEDLRELGNLRDGVADIGDLLGLRHCDIEDIYTAVDGLLKRIKELEGK